MPKEILLRMKKQTKMFLKIYPNYFIIVKVNSYMVSCDSFSRKNDLRDLYWDIWVEYHFTSVSPLRNFS